jgi:hypothetical protein
MLKVVVITVVGHAVGLHQLEPGQVGQSTGGGVWHMKFPDGQVTGHPVAMATQVLGPVHAAPVQLAGGMNAQDTSPAPHFTGQCDGLHQLEPEQIEQFGGGGVWHTWSPGAQVTGHPAAFATQVLGPIHAAPVQLAGAANGQDISCAPQVVVVVTWALVVVVALVAVCVTAWPLQVVTAT